MKKLQTPSLIQFLQSKVLLFVSMGVFIVILGSLYYADGHFRITEVAIQPASKNNQNIRGIQSLKGDYIWLLDEQETASFIKSRNANIKEVKVTKQFPNKIILTISYYIPLAVIKVPDGYFMLGDEAVILEKSREPINSSLPQISYYQNISFANYQAGQDLNFDDIKDALFYMQRLANLKIKINSIDIKGFNMLGLYTKDMTYMFSAEKERELQAYQLEATIKEFRISGRKIKSLDVRFDKPVVTLDE